MLPIRIINRSSYPLPQYATVLSAGLDLRANLEQNVSLAPLERRLVPADLHIEIPAGHKGQMRPHSGLTIKRGLTVFNAPGAIDVDYRSEFQIVLINLPQETVEITPNERIVQSVFTHHEQCDWIEVKSLSDTQRGDSGFRYTGI